jgi:hypothetical protein
MRLPQQNQFANIFVQDPLPPLAAPQYESDVDTPIILLRNFSIEFLPVGQARVMADVHQLATEHHFNALVTQAIIKAHTAYGNTFDTLVEAHAYFTNLDLPGICSVMITQNRDIYATELNPIRNTARIVRADIPQQDAYLITEPEYFGVVPIRQINAQDEHYGLAIMNTRGVVKLNLP